MKLNISSYKFDRIINKTKVESEKSKIYFQI